MSPKIECDIVLLTWNRADLLKPCVERILRFTDVPSRLLLVDNASTEPEAVEYQQRLKGNGTVQVEVIRRTHNDGFSKGINEGLRRATAPWVCLMNNDVLVAQGWLSEMIRVAKAHPEIGLLNPMSNEFGAWPGRGETIDQAGERVRPRRGEWTEFWNCVGFCALMPRQILEKVGMLDEEFGFMYYEDADYSLRVRQAGYCCGIALGAYAYHIGSATMSRNPDKERLFEANKELFRKKWGLPRSERIAWLMPQGHNHFDDSLKQREQIRFLANQDHIVWVYCTPYNKSAVPRHLNVFCEVLPAPVCVPVALLKILLKKKGFQRLILSSDKQPSSWMHWVGRITKTRVETPPSHV
ncbi:MAG: glycosyltransferase family 2 protein [Candidatus Omnitrophica bacterium]|nr:glycosyltransferase family 2 protein [Candidatus Omnitrophota bacterium]